MPRSTLQRILLAAVLGFALAVGSVHAGPVFGEPVQIQVDFQLAPGVGGANQFYTVPARKKLVIEHVTGVGFGAAGQRLGYSVITTLSGASVWHTLGIGDLVVQPGQDSSTWSGPVRLYAGPGTTVMLRLDRNTGDASTAAHGRMTFSGQLYD